MHMEGACLLLLVSACVARPRTIIVTGSNVQESWKSEKLDNHPKTHLGYLDMTAICYAWNKFKFGSLFAWVMSLTAL